ncbi:MAG: 2-oxoglutarate dehydrogenase E1 component [Desulfuromonadales bacterium]|nr:2-oxoglutarate dehydrogenase E1 component [Desulfuromonadales bacterium]MBN2792203.1 2-oxoglutarate dehydrogenase E1 component [Desulfuromonadales bacterium]
MSRVENVSPQWIEAQYQAYKNDPQSVPDEWQSFFKGFDLGMENRDLLAPDHKPAAVQSMIRRYRDIGHIYACVDPLTPCKLDHPLLNLSEFGLEEADLQRTFATDSFILPEAPLKDIIDVLQQTYCRSLGLEFMHIPIPEERKWLHQHAEASRNRSDISRGRKFQTIKMLLRATKFESFLHRKFVGQKRFSLEGAESLIPLLDHLVEKAAELSIQQIVIGMPHRGRLNVLANIFEKPLENIFTEFSDNERYQIVGEGDVKYHKGYTTYRQFIQGRIRISLASNPSHLEAVDPVVEGKVRARQDRLEGDGQQLVMPLLIHGDAAFAGQGMVTETLNLSQLAGYKTGGTLHLIVNNQIGFTTTPEDARSTPYATDVAKMLNAPIFHVHGDDPEALIQAASMAIEYRQQFRKDVIIEMICYRRHGHNEGDEPFFTQPLMYEKIRNHPLTADIYKTQLLLEGFKEEEFQEVEDAFDKLLEAALDSNVCPLHEIFLKQWSHISREFSFDPVATGVDEATLNQLSAQLTTLPKEFTPHRKIAALLKKRHQAVTEGQAIDWGTGEALAFASLVNQGTSVRLSGQDSRRGTFNHRHATLYDNKTGEEYTALAQIASQADCRFDVFNSMLSEAAVLGFDYGYSVETPDDLTIWEAQFGDFANGAQVIIDQFIASSLAKWDRPTGITMFLPHGYEGQGPEHSSARIERYLQLCAGNNMQVVNPSTPAQLFHVLRRQVSTKYRRPLIVFTPKALLRHPACVSTLKDLTSGHFKEIIGDDLKPEGCRRVLLCSGKIYYDLLQQRSDCKHEDVAIIRIDQLYPLHKELLKKTLEPYKDSVEYFWVQEEIANGGGWDYLRPRLRDLIGTEPVYVGRKRSASTAVGSHRIHKKEQQDILDRAFATLK